MKCPFLFLLFISSIFYLNGQYTWSSKACLPAANRAGQAGFSVGNKGYIVGGVLESLTNVADVWQYNPSTGTWIQKNDFPGGARAHANAFVISDTAYVGLGLDNNNVFHTDYYRYNAGNDTWTQIASFPGDARYTAMSFVINGKAYVGCGFNGNLYNDFYQYDPGSDTWTQEANFSGSERQTGFGATDGTFGYMGLGYDGSNFLSDCYKYNPVTNTWSQIASMSVGCIAPSSFAINDTFYVAAGESPTGFLTDCWMYDANTDTWLQQRDFSCLGQGRDAAFGFSLNGHGYVVCGAFGYANFTPQLLEFGPNDTAFVTRVHVLGNDTSYCNNFSRILSTGNPCTLWSTGVTASQITVTSTGTYWAYWPDSCGMASDTIHITVGTPTSFSLGNDTAYCGNFSRTFFTGNPATVWSTGVTASHITVSSPGTYWGTISNICGTVSDTIRIAQNPTPVVDLGSDTTLCIGETLLLNATNVNSTYKWQNNSTNPTYKVTAPGTYSVTVTNNHGCETHDSIVVGFTTPPVTIALGNDTTYCGGFSRTLTSNYPSTQWSTGATASQITVTTPGTFWAAVHTSCGNASDTITIGEITPPAVNLGNDTVLCAGHKLVLNAGYSNATYLWQNHSTGPTDTVTQSGLYSVTITVSGCSAPASIRISIDSLGPVKIHAADSIFCANDSALICAPAGYSLYQWNAGGSHSCLEAKDAGNYYVTVTDEHGCTAESNHIPIKVYPVPSVTLVVRGDTLSSLGAVGYQWIYNGSPISGDTGTVYIAREPGIYMLQITDTNGCTILSLPYTITGIADLQEGRISIAPNPSAGNWQVIVEGELIGSQLQVYNGEGRLVFKSEIRSQNTEIAVDLPGGVYLLQISSPTINITRKLVRL